MKNWSEEQKKEHRKKLRKIRNQKRKKKNNCMLSFLLYSLIDYIGVWRRQFVYHDKTAGTRSSIQHVLAYK